MAADLSQYVEEFTPRKRENLTATVSVGTARTTVLPANPNRTQAVLVNFSSNIVTVGTEPDITTSNGIPVPPDRGVVILRKRDEGEDIYREWFAIASAAATSIGRTGYERMAARKVA